MERIRDRVAGLDVHRDRVVACLRVSVGGDVETMKSSFPTMSAGIGQLAEWLREHEANTVAMEATGVYWKPVYYGLEGLIGELWLVNAAHVKRVPGRKTDLSDAEWLADVAAHGMVRPSFVPPAPIRELRELTRYRKTQVDVRVKEIQRLEKLLQDAGIKLTSVASRTWSKSALAIVEALIAGERDPENSGRTIEEQAAGEKGTTGSGALGTFFRASWRGCSPDPGSHRLLGRLHRAAHRRDRRAHGPF